VHVGPDVAAGQQEVLEPAGHARHASSGVRAASRPLHAAQAVTRLIQFQAPRLCH